MHSAHGAAACKRPFLGTELVNAVDRFPCRIEDYEDSETGHIDLGTIVRLARTAERGDIDYLIIDDTLAGNPPYSGRRRDAFEALHLAVRLAPTAHGVRVAPRIHSAWIEPTRLLSELVGLELAARGHMAWQLDVPEPQQSRSRGPELLAAIVEDVWIGEQTKTSLAAMARAHRARRIREGLTAYRQTSQADDDVPILLVQAAGKESERLGAKHADVVRIEAASPDEARERRSTIRAQAETAGRDPNEVHVAVDMSICLNSVEENAFERAELIESITAQPLGGQGARYIGTPSGLAESMAYWLDTECCDGFTFLPASLPIDLVLAVDRAVPELRRRAEPQMAHAS
ncbi:MAG: LLM class flavin-dependent oxidoreductase [Bifidobacteriaceae bacterium]|jgi:alkanesulfonate monooxygenase SsuD/methylene tetrahydromethanopterin reductase-like flavin-dependent oxidoreductase (luciferase family)|nr:LLM class flavin-dependent oxidoreductase [Bifidobacteriaceae bacterium]